MQENLQQKPSPAVDYAAAKPRRQSWSPCAIFLSATEHLGLQLARYIVVGGVSTVADFGTLVLLTSCAGIHYLISNVGAFIVGLTVNYILSIVWVFGSRTMNSKVAEFLLFAVIGVVGLGISQVVMYAGVELVHVHYALAKVAAVGATLFWNFGIRRALLFRQKAAVPKAID